MSFTAAAIAAGALGAAGGLLDTGINAWSADRLQNKSFEENERNRKWEEYMASNKYQMMVSDLQKAGLNPALALGGASAGPGSTAPSGSAQAMSGASIGASINKAVNSYLSYTLGSQKNALAFAKELRIASAELRSNSAESYANSYDDNGGLTEI